MPTSASRSTPSFLPQTALNDLVTLLRNQGYTVIAPTVDAGVITYAPITTGQQIARGVIDYQDGGTYRLSATEEPELQFQYVVGANGPKRFLFPPTQRMYEFRAEKGGFVQEGGPPPAPKLAFLGVRSCDLAAMSVQDRVFSEEEGRGAGCLAGAFYTEARRQAMVIAVNCTRPSGTCFCASMGTGPEASEGFDLALTEQRGGFVVTVGSEKGGKLLEGLPGRKASAAEQELAELKLARAREHMGRHLERAGLKEVLDRAVEHPRWDEVAQRCLSCGNCTMVCPTCFCSTVSDSSALDQGTVTRTRYWESCFTHQFSYTTAGPVRNTIRGRYRHWLRHKLSTWIDQFGCSGCVGCGRCITWCPVGIDLTVEARQIRQSQPAENGGKSTQEKRA